MNDEDTSMFVLDCIDAAFPDGRAQLLAAQRLPLGLNDLWRLRVGHAGTRLDLVLRRYRHGVTWHADGDRAQADREAAALAHVRAHGLPAPAIYGHGDGWTLVEYVRGVRLGARDAPEPVDARAVRALAALLAALHRLALPDGPFPRVSTESAIRTMHERAAAAGDDRLARAVARLRPLDEETPVLVHGDPNLGNVLFDDACNVAALIDWEDAAIADPRFDVATAYWFLLERAPAVAADFIAAYESASGSPLRELERWLAFQSLRAWAVADALRSADVPVRLFSTEAEMAEAERRLAEVGW